MPFDPDHNAGVGFNGLGVKSLWGFVEGFFCGHLGVILIVLGGGLGGAALLAGFGGGFRTRAPRSP